MRSGLSFLIRPFIFNGRPVFFFVHLLIFLILPKYPQNQLQAQKFVRDSLVVHFNTQLNQEKLPLGIDTIQDDRNLSPRNVGSYEIKKYLLIPVDLDIYITKPLREEIREIIPAVSSKQDSSGIGLVIKEFSVTKKSGGIFFTRYQLTSSFQIYWGKALNQERFIGELLYEINCRPAFFRDKISRGFQRVLDKWQLDFTDDIQHITYDLQTGQIPRLENLRFEIYSDKYVNMYNALDWVKYRDGFATDLEIFFSHREAQPRFIRSGGYQLRYKNSSDFESIGFALSVGNFFWRLDRIFLFKGKSQLVLGVNRWNNIQTTPHKIYDAFIFEFILNQSITYNPLDKRSLLIGIGLQQEIFYVYSKDWRCQIGPYVHLGIKL
jgi:hypothetical protein